MSFGTPPEKLFLEKAPKTAAINTKKPVWHPIQRI